MFYVDEKVRSDIRHAKQQFLELVSQCSDQFVGFNNHISEFSNHWKTNEKSCPEGTIKGFLDFYETVMNALWEKLPERSVSGPHELLYKNTT